MFTLYSLKKKSFIWSNRDFMSDYSKIMQSKIDMTLSGSFLGNCAVRDFKFKEMDQYPQKKYSNMLENLLKEKFKINEEIILGAGANGLLQNLIKIFFVNRGNLVTPFYTFNQAEFGVSSFEGKTKRVFMTDYHIDLNEIRKSIDKKTRMIYLCNPNNPTGLCMDSKEILEFVESINIPVVVDESGIELTGKRSLANEEQFPDNLIVLKSFSKVYGIANFRIGFLICKKAFKNEYMKKITGNEFSGLSCAYAIELLNNHQNEIEKNIKNIRLEREKIVKELKKLKISCIDSESNIIMTSSKFNSKIMDIFLDEGISVVPIYDEFNKLHLRIAVQKPKINSEFLKHMKKILDENENILE